MDYQTRDHYRRIDLKLVVFPSKQWFSDKLACNPYVFLSLLNTGTNMNPRTRGTSLFFKLKEAWRTARVRGTAVCGARHDYPGPLGGYSMGTRVVGMGTVWVPWVRVPWVRVRGFTSKCG